MLDLFIIIIMKAATKFNLYIVFANVLLILIIVNFVLTHNKNGFRATEATQLDL